MKAKRYRALILVSGLLMALVLLLFLGERGKSKGRKLILRDAESIDLIRVCDRGDTVFLQKFEDTWLVNGMDEAHPMALENLLYVAANFQIASVLEKPPFRDEEEGRLLSFYMEGKKVLEYEFYALDGRYYIKSPDTEHYLGVNLPGYAGTKLSEVFSSHAGHYLEHMLIRLPPSEIRMVEVQRRGERTFCFTQDEEGQITSSFHEADTFAGADKTAGVGMDELSVRLLFSYFTAIRYEVKASEYEGLLDPGNEDLFLGALQVESRDGDSHRMKVYSLPVESGKDVHMFKACVYYNNESEPLIVNYIYLDVLLRGPAAYFGDNP